MGPWAPGPSKSPGPWFFPKAIWGPGPGAHSLTYGPWACPVSYGMRDVLWHVPCPMALSYVPWPCPMFYGPVRCPMALSYVPLID